MYSLGATMIIVLLGHPLFKSCDGDNFNYLIKENNLKKYLLTPKYNLSKECVDCISKLTQHQEVKRSNIDEMLAHPWFNNLELSLKQYHDEFTCKINCRKSSDSLIFKVNHNST